MFPTSVTSSYLTLPAAALATKKEEGPKQTSSPKSIAEARGLGSAPPLINIFTTFAPQWNIEIISVNKSDPWYMDFFTAHLYLVTCP